jgi:hypothetical protein
VNRKENLAVGARVQWKTKRDPLTSDWGGVGTIATLTDTHVSLDLVRMTTKGGVSERRTFKLSEIEMSPD